MTRPVFLFLGQDKNEQLWRKMVSLSSKMATRVDLHLNKLCRFKTVKVRKVKVEVWST